MEQSDGNGKSGTPISLENEGKFLADILEMTIKVFQAEGGFIRLYDPSTGELVIRAHQGIEAKRLKDFMRRKYGEGRSWQAFLSRKPVITKAKDVISHYIEHPLSYLTMPLSTGDEPFGTITLFASTSDLFREEQLDFFTYIGNQIGLSLKYARLSEENLRHTKTLATLYEFSQALVQATDFEEMLSTLLNKVVELLMADAGMIRLLEEETKEMVLMAHRGFSEEEIKYAVPRRKFGEGSAWNSILSGKPSIRISHNGDPPTFGKKAGFAVSVRIPLIARDRPLGNISIHQRVKRDFTAEEIELFSHLGNLLGMAIENARLFRELEKKNESLAILFTISQTVNQSLNPESIMSEALDKIVSLFSAHSADIRLWNEETKELVYVAQKGLSPEDFSQVTQRRKLTNGTTSLAVEARKTVFIEDVRTDPRTAGRNTLTERLGCSSLITTPLLHKGKLMGVMNVRFAKGRSFSAKEVELFTSIGNLIGTALGNARLYEEKEAVIKELDRTREKWQHSQKMEAIGTLAGGIAHDFNNLLMAILGNVSLMLIEAKQDHPFYQRLKNIEKQVERGARLTEQILGYARKGKYVVKPLDLNRLIEDVIGTFGRTKREIRYHFNLASDLRYIYADQNQIEQVLLNLLTNAADAMPRGGDLYIKTENVSHEEIRNKPYDPAPGLYVHLQVRDTGIGMDKDTKARIFEPFFTTKEMGRGTGLGLASVYGIIKGHSGYIDVESEKYQGATFNIYLPASDKIIEETARTPFHFTGGTETILFADDEELVLDVGTEMMKNLGYTVIAARGGKQAVELYRKHKDTIELVILDVVMPDLSGLEACEQIRTINPQAKVILASGYGLDRDIEAKINQGMATFIQKPFDLKNLSQEIRSVLEGKKNAP